MFTQVAHFKADNAWAFDLGDFEGARKRRLSDVDRENVSKVK